MDARVPFDKDVLDRTPPEVLEYIGSLLDKIEKLNTVNHELNAKLGMNSSNSSMPPSSDRPNNKPKRKPPRKPSGRKRGGQPNHPRHTRPLVPTERVDKFVPCMPDSCNQCGAELDGEDPDPKRHQTAEIPPVEPIVTEYQLHELECSECGGKTRGELPPGTPTGAFGPRLTAIMAMLVGVCRLGKRKIQQLMSDLFGLSISLGMICKLERRTSAALEEPTDELRDYIRGEPVNIDETSWREGKRRCWLWVAVTKLVTVFIIAYRRNGDVARKILGEDYCEAATSDRHGAYNWIELRQLCWAHLMRDFQAMIDRGGAGKAIGELLLIHAQVQFDWWHKFQQGKLKRSTLKRYIALLRETFIEDLQRGIECGCAKTAGTCKNLLRDEEHLWTFAYVKDVEPTNNAGEREVRHPVLYRKTSGGTDSAAGSRYIERILSVVATCRRQGRNILSYLTACLQADLEGQPAPSLLPDTE